MRNKTLLLPRYTQVNVQFPQSQVKVPFPTQPGAKYRQGEEIQAAEAKEE